jgi:parvulin-like peptidyl-prolyl isomerase
VSSNRTVMERRHGGLRANNGSGAGSPWRARTIGLIILAVIFAVPTYGYYRVYVQPANEWTARIDGDVITTVGDVAERLQAVSLLNEAEGANFLTDNPYEAQRSMVEEELIWRAAQRLQFAITNQAVDEALRDRFLPQGAPASTTSEGQLEREFNESYSRFLTRGRLSDEQYRRLVRIQIYRESLKQELALQIPAAMEQVEIAWILLPPDFEEEDSVLTILEEESLFENVAQQLNTESYYANSSRPGYVGWVPVGAFPQLDPYLFTEPPKDGALVGPVPTRDGTYIIKVLSGAQVHKIENPKMVELLKEAALLAWVQNEWDAQAVELRFTSKDYDWVFDRVEENMPVAN